MKTLQKILQKWPILSASATVSAHEILDLSVEHTYTLLVPYAQHTHGAGPCEHYI